MRRLGFVVACSALAACERAPQPAEVPMATATPLAAAASDAAPTPLPTATVAPALIGESTR